MGKSAIRYIGILSLMVLSIIICSCSDSDETKVEEDFTYSKILGKWETTAYFCSDGYFVQTDVDEWYQFNDDQTYSYNNMGDIEHGTFRFDHLSNIIDCKEQRGWDKIIRVTFRDKDKAVFDIVGKTEIQSSKIIVERKTPKS